ncbi:glycosyltransferase family 2 protein [Micromonospora tarensis]|uniref:Glycosyltransferase family 2 protein n=1 Tax=Micromonospora tarensis TaxID=2806100 RepID=A0ABS1YMN3_9ACTN|nr:glycosyltransferase family 2 protein [Micromonospora tarensis]MBM0278548.1 glycosyltransferase family 2 protein [Micromonospora tarensis]
MPTRSATWRPTVSVVIPSVGKPGLRRAVESVLAQTHPVTEVHVVLNSETDVDLPGDPRVRLLRYLERRNGNAARMAGVRRCTGDLVAFLDDDDLWHPTKIERQVRDIAEAGLADSSTWISSTKVVVDFAHGSETWPRAPYDPSLSLENNLLQRHRVQRGQAFLPSSTLLFPRSLPMTVPLNEELSLHQDLTWLLQLSRTLPDLAVRQVDAALTRYDAIGDGISRSISLDRELDWAREYLGSATPRDRGDYYLGSVMTYARRQGTVGGMVGVFSEGLRVGRPGAAAVGYACGAMAAGVVKAVAAGVRQPRRRGDETDAGAEVR